MLTCLALATVIAGCVGHDSRWAQQKAEQKRAVERLRPATLRRDGPSSKETRTAYIRAHATRAYVTETLHWEDRFEELLHQANAVLKPALGVTLQNGGTYAWQPSAPAAGAQCSRAASARSKS